MGLYGFLGRSAAGAALGAWAGGEGNRGKGAIIGGAMGGFGPLIGRRLYGMNNMAGRGLRGIGGFANAGMSRAGFALGALGTGRFANMSLAAKSNFARRGFGYLSAAASGAGNAIRTNKYGGVALTMLGAASAASIGSSIMGSNNGY